MIRATSSADASTMSSESDPQDKPPTLLQTMGSVMASFFGVQSSKNRERDFKHGKASHFIVLGIVATLLFIATVWGAVKIALHLAQS